LISEERQITFGIKHRMDIILKSIVKHQIPFLIGGTITGVIMTYSYGFLFTIIVNSAI